MTAALGGLHVPEHHNVLRQAADVITPAWHQASRVVAVAVTVVFADVLGAAMGVHPDQSPTAHHRGGTR